MVGSTAGAPPAAATDNRSGGRCSRFGDALRAALSDVDPAVVRASVIGIAGWFGAAHPGSRDALRPGLGRGRTDLRPGLRVPDLKVAFAGGTPASEGAVLVAGTGAAAGSPPPRLTRTAGGHGWLLGDDGSGFWLGREALQGHLADTRCGRKARCRWSTPCSASWTLTSERRARQRERVIQAVNSRPGVLLSALAPLVTRGLPDRRPAGAVHRRARRGSPAGDPRPDPRPGREHADRPRGKPGRRRVPGGSRAANAARARFSGDVLPARTGVGGAAWRPRGAGPALATRETHARLCS